MAEQSGEQSVNPVISAISSFLSLQMDPKIHGRGEIDTGLVFHDGNPVKVTMSLVAQNTAISVDDRKLVRGRQRTMTDHLGLTPMGERMYQHLLAAYPRVHEMESRLTVISQGMNPESVADAVLHLASAMLTLDAIPIAAQGALKY